MSRRQPSSLSEPGSSTGLFGLVLVPCYYIIDGSALLIRSGLICYRVSIDGIQAVTRSANPLSAPAPSLKRVKIQMKDGKYHLVCPADREGFMEELKRLAGVLPGEKEKD